jgi:hypothetical protein
MPMSPTGIVWIIGFLLLTVVVFSLIARKSAVAFIYDIKLNNAGIEFVLFSFWRIYVLSFSNIEYVKEMKHGGLSALRAYNFKNRFFHRTFLIKKKKGFFTRQVLVTPEDETSFVRALTQAGVEIK